MRTGISSKQTGQQIMHTSYGLPTMHHGAGLLPSIKTIHTSRYRSYSSQIHAKESRVHMRVEIGDMGPLSYIACHEKGKPVTVALNTL